MSTPSDHLYQKAGGEEGLATLVEAFYQRVLGDESLAPFFKNSSMENLRHMQREFFAMALGGPVSYSGKPLAHAHHGRGITPTHFASFVNHLVDTLRDTDLTQEDIDEIISRIDTYANEVTGTSY